MREFLPVFFLLLMAACRPMEYAPPPPTPEHIDIIYTPALGWMEDILHQCALDHPEMALTVAERPLSSLDVEAAELILELGPAPQGFDGHAVLLGWEQIVIIADPKIPASQLELPDLQHIYTSTETAYQAWSYAENDQLRIIFDQAILKGIPPSSHTKIAPGPTAMLASTGEASGAVGYLPESWLVNAGPQVIPISEETASALRQPILALTQAEPEGIRREYIACLADSLENK